MNDNVRKVFNMLGLEPGEEFKVEDSNSFWKINENLNLYYRQGHYNNGDYAYNGFDNSLIIYLIKNPKLILKLPKEPRKKKLRDLTEEEWNKWRDVDCYERDSCVGCIFRNVPCAKSNNEKSWFNNKDLYSDKFLDQEVEVEE